jgi:hypothetical protein
VRPIRWGLVGASALVGTTLLMHLLVAILDPLVPLLLVLLVVLTIIGFVVIGR